MGRCTMRSVWLYCLSFFSNVQQMFEESGNALSDYIDYLLSLASLLTESNDFGC